MLKDYLFKNLNDYRAYLNDHPFYELINIDVNNLEEINNKSEYEPFRSVDPKNDIPLEAEIDDLTRLHYLITSRKVSTILEFGVGASTLVFNNALDYNKAKYSSYFSENLRRSNAFECYSIDNSKKWIEYTKKQHDFNNVIFHYTDCEVSTFNGRVCTFYNNLPNICPDFIYIDAPDQFSVGGDIRGISTRHEDRLPMSADVLSIEHFLLPGTLIVLDGRTANARFLKKNLQRNWEYLYSEEFDQHFFELKEKPLGPYNKKQIEFCLGIDWMSD